ncbi:hypothetical protein ACN47E_003081 [Coniothyrium glycines]
MAPYEYRREFDMQKTGGSPFVWRSAIRVYKPYAWVFCASVSLLSARHLLVEQNIHYPLQLYFTQLAVFAIMKLRFPSVWQYTQKLLHGDLHLSISMTRGTTLLVASMCFTSLSTICFLQATLHFHNLPTLVMTTMVALFAERFLLYITHATPHTHAELLRISLLALVGAALLFVEYRLTVPNLAMSIVAMLLAGVARCLLKLVNIYSPDRVEENRDRTSLRVVAGALIGVAWMIVFETGHQKFGLDIGSIPLLTLNAMASAGAMFLGKSLLLPLHSEVAETLVPTIDAPEDRIWDALTLTLLTGITGCYTSVLLDRSYTNMFQFCCFLLTVAYMGSNAYTSKFDVASKKAWIVTHKYELVSSPTLSPPEEDDTFSITEEEHYRKVPASMFSSPKNKLHRYVLGAGIALLWAAYGALNFTERQECGTPDILLDREYLPQMPLEIVLSMYKEPIDDVGRLVRRLRSTPTLSDAIVTIYIKDDDADSNHIKMQTGADDVIPLPNVGREGETFLNHILTRWNNLARQTIFLQAGIHNPREFHTHLSNYFDRARTGFLGLGWPGRICDCEDCGDRFGWQDNIGFIPQLYNQMYNATSCENVLLSYKGQFIVSAARIRGIRRHVYHDLWRAFVDEDSWAHQPDFLQGRPDSMSAPDFGYSMERVWNLLFQCSSVEVGWKCPTLISEWRLGGDISDCQCFDT